MSRWRKYGKDRLYVNGADGVRIGWLDNISGERVIERPEFAAAFEAAVANEGVSPGALPSCADRPNLPRRHRRSVASEPIWVDLAENRPGQAARKQAIAEREAMREAVKAWHVHRAAVRPQDRRASLASWCRRRGGRRALGSRPRNSTAGGSLHAVNVGTQGSDIDHVVIGPGGVYTLNTKTHRGHRVTVYERAIFVDGYKQPYLRNSRHEAERAARLSDASMRIPS